MWFGVIVWEGAFTGYNNVTVWFAARQRVWCSRSHSCDVELLGFTGELFAVAPVNPTIVSALVMTDSATMEIKMTALCQGDMHANGKFTGPEVSNEPQWAIRLLNVTNTSWAFMSLSPLIYLEIPNCIFVKNVEIDVFLLPLDDKSN